MALTPYEVEVARRVIDARERLGLTKTELAEKLGISKQAYTPYESLKTPYTLGQLEIVSRLTGLPLTHFLGLPSATTGLTPDETTMLAVFRRLPPTLQGMAIRLITAIVPTE